MRSIALISSFVLPGLAMAPGIDSAHAQDRLPCVPHAPAGVVESVECLIDSTGTTQRFSFKINFSGGHDDTTASMTASLDGLPLICEEGSKTTIEGEFGDVSLECRFAVTGKPGEKRILKFSPSWRHAEYSDFVFSQD
jgi:hypothetical protein